MCDAFLIQISNFVRKIKDKDVIAFS